MSSLGDHGGVTGSIEQQVGKEEKEDVWDPLEMGPERKEAAARVLWHS